MLAPIERTSHLEEHFEVISGTLGLMVDGKEHLLRAGEHYVVPQGVRHLPRNAGEDELRLVGEIRPAGRFEGFLREITAADNRAHAAGRTGLAWLLTGAPVLYRYLDVEHPTPLPRLLERALFAVLARRVERLVDRRPATGNS